MESTSQSLTSWMLNTSLMLKLELLLKNSQWFQTQDHPTSGFTHQTVGLFHAGCIQLSITPNQPPTQRTEKLSISLTDLDPSKVQLVKTLLRSEISLQQWDSEKSPVYQEHLFMLPKCLESLDLLTAPSQSTNSTLSWIFQTSKIRVSHSIYTTPHKRAIWSSQEWIQKTIAQLTLTKLLNRNIGLFNSIQSHKGIKKLMHQNTRPSSTQELHS